MSGARRADDVRITKELIVINKLGIHARPAAMFVKTANRFDCQIFVEKDGERVNGKSIMGLMMLAAGPGSKLTVQAEGGDAARGLKLERVLPGSPERASPKQPLNFKFSSCNLQLHSPCPPAKSM